MTLRTDHSFHIGEQHLKNGKPAQDYALSGKLNENMAYAIVSDGCSSGGMTDIGARLMALSTKRALTELVKDNFFQSETQVMAVNSLRNAYLEAYRAALDLDYRDLLATCLWAVVGPEGAFYHVTGDGVVLIRYRNSWRMETYEWAKNTPYYPAYHLGGMDSGYRDSYAEDPEPFSRTLTASHGDGIDAILTEKFDVAYGMRGFNYWPELMGESGPGPLTDIVLFSDGVEQIQNIDSFDAASELTWFKSTQGQFAVRRMNRFLAESKKVGRGPIDDISMAVIHRDDETKT